MAKLTKLLTATDEIRKTFTMIPNSISYEYNLSAKAWGLLIKILMLPDDWDFSESGLSKHFKDSRDSIASGLRELEAAGYLYREQRRVNGRLGSSDYTVSDVPRRDFMNAYYERERKKKGREQLSELPELNLPNAFEQSAPWQGAPLLEIPTTGAPSTESAHNNIYTNNTLKNNRFNNSSQCKKGADAPGDFATQNFLDNETGGLGEALAESSLSVSTPPVPAQSETALSETDRVLKQLKKKYKSAFVDYALELSQDKDDSIAYMKSVLRDWKKQNLKSIQEVQRYVSSFEDEKVPDLTISSYVTAKPIRRVEQTPSWLHQEQKHYDANRQLSAEEQQAVDRMKQMQSDLLDQYAANLPF